MCLLSLQFKDVAGQTLAKSWHFLPRISPTDFPQSLISPIEEVSWDEIAILWMTLVSTAWWVYISSCSSLVSRYGGIEIYNVNSSTKGPPLTAVKAGKDMLYLHPGWKPLMKGKVFSGFLYVVSAMDGLGLPTADACFCLLSCAIIKPFLFSLAGGAQEIL